MNAAMIDTNTASDVPQLRVYAVTDNSNPTNTILQVAYTPQEAVAQAAAELFGLHAELTDLEPDDLLVVK